MLANHVMPPEYENVKSLILCNDCEEKSTTKFHFVYHKCQKCQSYNTKIIKTFTSLSEESDIDNDEQEQIISPRP
jgi:RING finger/CHY zinc finger protein 1